MLGIPPQHPEWRAAFAPHSQKGRYIFFPVNIPTLVHGQCLLLQPIPICFNFCSFAIAFGNLEATRNHLSPECPYFCLSALWHEHNGTLKNNMYYNIFLLGFYMRYYVY